MNIQKPNKATLGGLSSLYIAFPSENPEVFYKIGLPPENAKYREKKRDGKDGVKYQHTIDFFVPQLRSNVLSFFYKHGTKPMVARVTSNNQIIRLVGVPGSKNEWLYLETRFNSGQKGTNSEGWDCTIKGETLLQAPILNNVLVPENTLSSSDSSFVPVPSNQVKFHQENRSFGVVGESIEIKHELGLGNAARYTLQVKMLNNGVTYLNDLLDVGIDANNLRFEAPAKGKAQITVFNIKL